MQSLVMLKFRLVSRFILIFFILLSTQAFSYNQKDPNDMMLSQQLFEYTNQYRISKGLLPLRWSQSIANICRTHSMNMGKRRVPFGHQGFKKRVSLISPKVRVASENVYMRNMDDNLVRACMNALIRSRGHEKNLSGNYNLCGIGVYKNSRGYWYFTQIFANDANKT